MNAATAWRTDEPCPVCGTGLNCIDDGTSDLQQDCPLCGWSTTWPIDPAAGGAA